MLRPFTTVSAVALALAGAAVLSAQQAPKFRSSMHAVEVHVTVRGSDDQLITGLTKDDFELYDNGKRRDITVFSADPQPIAVALVLDHSGSVAVEADKITSAADAFVGKLAPIDRAAVNSLMFECQPLTDNLQKLREILRSPMPNEGSPVWAGLDRTLTSLVGVTGRRAVLLISDGDDAGQPMSLPSMGGPCHAWSDPSEATFSDTAKRAQRDGVMIYTVTVDAAAGLSHDDDMKSIAKGSGGERFRLKQDTDLPAAFERIVDELHHQYLLGFSPQGFDGTVHSLSVKVKRPGVSVRARESYASIDADQPTASSTAREPARPLTDAEVQKAIRDGESGQRAQASCVARGVFPKRPDETEAMAEITLEGPAGVIMRMARDAKAARSTFGFSDVTADMRAPIVQASSEIKRSLRPADPILSADEVVFPTPAPTTGTISTPSVLSPLTSVRLRSKLLTEVLLRPVVAMSSTPNPSTSLRATPLTRGNRRVDRFDLNAFRALPGADVEVVVRSSTGPRYCTITAKDRLVIR